MLREVLSCMSSLSYSTSQYLREVVTDGWVWIDPVVSKIINFRVEKIYGRSEIIHGIFNSTAIKFNNN